MRRGSQEDDLEAAREPLLPGSTGGAAGGSRGPSPEREDGQQRAASAPIGTIRLTKRSSTAAQQDDQDHHHQQQGGIVLKDAGEHESDVRELEVEVVAGAVAEAVAEAVHEAVQEAVHDAVQQAIEDHVQFDVRGNVYTLIAVAGVILFWRGVWNTWDVLFGADSLASNLGSLFVGLAIMSVIRALDLPLVQGLPGG